MIFAITSLTFLKYYQFLLDSSILCCDVVNKINTINIHKVLSTTFTDVNKLRILTLNRTNQETLTQSFPKNNLKIVTLLLNVIMN